MFKYFKLFKIKVDIDELHQRFWLYKEKADRFLFTKKGTWLRFGIMGGMLFVYPLANVLTKGPFVNTMFTWRYKLIDELPDRLKKTIEQQSFVWLEKEGKNESDTYFNFTCQKDAQHSLDSVRMGTLSSPTGAQIALPFYAQFNNEEEAYEYAKKYLEPFNVLGKTACIIWESDVGKEILKTFVLSNEALAFLVARDLYGVQRPYLLTQEALSWFCYIFIAILMFYCLHIFSFNGDSIVFAIALPLLCIMGVFSAFEWNKLAVYLSEFHADTCSASLSNLHTKGGQEYYMKFLNRNRLLKDLVDGGDKLFSNIGEVKKSIAKYVSRYDGINDVVSENNELTISIMGDELPEEEGKNFF